MLKRLLTILLAVVLCFVVVACDKDVPVDPVGPGTDTPVTPVDPGPIDPGDPDIPVVPDPSGPSAPTGVIGAKRCLGIVDVFNEFGVPTDEVDADVLLGMLGEEKPYEPRQAWEELVFAVLESTDDILEEPYLEFDGKPYWLVSRMPDSQNIVKWALKEIACESAEYRIVEDTSTTGRLSIDVKGLAFKVSVTNPEGFTIDTTMDISISTFIKYEAGRDRWFWDEERPITMKATVDGVEWPEFETLPMNFAARYGEDFFDYGYTVSFDTKGGEPIDSMRFPGVLALDPGYLPSAEKENALFRGWELSPGDLLQDHENFLWPDCGETVNLTAVYWETTLPAELETEANLTYRFFETLSEVTCTYKVQTELQDLFDGSVEEKNLKFLDMLLLLIGEEDTCGEYPYLKVEGDRYYGSRKDEGASGFKASTDLETSDYKFHIEGTVTTNGGNSSYWGNYRSRSYAIGDVSIDGIIPSWSATGAFGRVKLDLSPATVNKTSVDDGTGYKLSVIEGEVEFRDVITGERHSRKLYYDATAGIGYYGDYLLIPDIWSRVSRVPDKD